MSSSKKGNKNDVDDDEADDDEVQQQQQQQQPETPETNKNDKKGRRQQKNNNSDGDGDDGVNDKELRSLIMNVIHQNSIIMPIMGIGSLSMIASSLSNQALPRIMGKFIDNTNNNNSNSSRTDSSGRSSSSWTTLTMAVVLGGGLASFLRTTMLDHAKDTIASSLRRKAFKVLMSEKDIEWFQSSTNTGTTTTSSISNIKSTTKTGAGDDGDNGKRKDTRIAKNGVNENITTTAGNSSSSSNNKKITATTKASSDSGGGGISPGAIAAILNEDVDKVSVSLTNSVANLLRSSSSVIFSTYHMLSLNTNLFLVSVSMVPAVGVAAMLLRKSMKKLATKQSNLADQLATFVEERLVNISLVKLANSEQREISEYENLQQQKQSVDKLACLQNGLFYGFIFIASSSSLLFVVSCGGKAVANGKLTSGQLSSFCTYSFLLGLGTSGIVKAIAEIHQGKLAAKRYYRLVQPPSQPIVVAPGAAEDDDDDLSASEGKGAASSNHSSASRSNSYRGTTSVRATDIGAVSFQDVCFTYKSSPEKPALWDVSFTLERGKVTALVGKNGSGKSTTAALLAGLYQPTYGNIVLSNKIDLKDVDKESKKNLVQVIPQINALFNMSILENVRYTNPEATESDVRNALRQANCDDIISKKDGGLNYVVGLNGCKLSGGERQRLALARALLTEPPVLIMDEPAASLDQEGSEAVQHAVEACRQAGRRRALLLITHSPKNLELVDEILVMKEGEIIEAGSLSDLKSNAQSYLCQLMPSLLL